jgi:hypothetical protein
MSLPTSLLTAVAGHGCFTGCFKPDRAASLCIDPVGSLTTALGVGVTAQAFADELSAQVQGLRGYQWSTSGYWANGGFWISAAYFGNGLFLVDGSRNGSQRTDLDMLIHAFRAGVVAPDDPRMLSSALYTSEVVYVDMTQLIGVVQDKQDLLASPACRTTRLHGYQRASVLEFIPMTRRHSSPAPVGTWPPPAVGPSSASSSASAAAAASSSASAPPTVRSTTPLGPSPANSAGAVAPTSATNSRGRCPDCGEEIKERLLFTGTYVGCLC